MFAELSAKAFENEKLRKERMMKRKKNNDRDI